MKQVIIINDSLKLPRGKLAAQVAHASLATFLLANPSHQQAWLEIGMPKIVLSADNEQEVVELYEKALAAQLPAQIVKDAGRTVIAPGTITCIGIGPAPETEIDRITGHMKLVS
jgi:peptidyl-tRNA hydrolase